MAWVKCENLVIEDVEDKDEISSLEGGHSIKSRMTRSEDAQGQNPLEPVLPLELVAAVG